jgi:hypothetical protein
VNSIQKRLRASINIDAINGSRDERAVCQSQMYEAANQIDALEARIATLEAAQTEIDGCFEAALIEGWIEALADGDIDRIRDIYNRRIEYVRGIVARTVAPPAQPSGKEG